MIECNYKKIIIITNMRNNTEEKNRYSLTRFALYISLGIILAIFTTLTISSNFHNLNSYIIYSVPIIIIAFSIGLAMYFKISSQEASSNSLMGIIGIVVAFIAIFLMAYLFIKMMPPQ